MRRRTIVLAVAAGLIATACQTGGPAGPGGSSTPSGPPTGTPTSTPTTTFEVWFNHGEWLFMTKRTVPTTPRVGAAAVAALVAGPSAVERTAGVVTSIPEGTELLGLSIAGDIVTVNLSRTYEAGGGSLSMFNRLAQLTYTLTQFPTVNGVNLELDGKTVRVFSGEGIILDRPMTRDSYRDRLPPILVERPQIGEHASSPITVSGTADVFEATVTISILDAEGNEIARTSTQATCGTGCRGTYSKAVRYMVGRTQLGTVRVYEISAKNGRPINIVEIPIVLNP